MPGTNSDLYAASVNPPRRAKRPTPAAAIQEDTLPASTSSVPRSIMPMKPYTPRASNSGPDPAEVPPPPAKRGRKPGPLSRTAREAQRRLNHSIIEKARRTKINDALAALKQLVPINYGQQQQTDAAAGSREQRNEDEDEYDDNDEDGDYEEGSSAKKSKTSSTATAKPKGKKEEKEKEFKLEILIRTVSFLEDLLKRVATLEAAATDASKNSVPSTQPVSEDSQPSTCPTCNAKLDKARRQHQGKKRKRVLSPSDVNGYTTDDDNDERDTPQGKNASTSLRRAKVARRSQNPSRISLISPPAESFPSAPAATLVAPVPISGPIIPKSQSPVDRLPSISSWLHPLDAAIDPQLLTASCGGAGSSGADASANGGPGTNSYLPSPPASTHFVPMRNTHGQPPLLNLGPVATAAMVVNGAVSGSGGSAAGNNVKSTSNSKSRTAEDESAASLLLQIAASPPFRAVRSSSFSSASSSASASAAASSMPAPDNAATQRSPISPGTPASRSRAGSVNGGWALPDPSNFMLHSGVRPREREADREWRTEKGLAAQQVQTPSSLLGLNLGLGGRY